MPCNRLMSFCNPVRSYRRGGRSFTRLRFTDMMRKRPCSAWPHSSIAASLLSIRSLESRHPPMSAITVQNGTGLWFLICRSRSAIMASVGVCTRPTLNRAL